MLRTLFDPSVLTVIDVVDTLRAIAALSASPPSGTAGSFVISIDVSLSVTVSTLPGSDVGIIGALNGSLTTRSGSELDN